MAFPASDLEPTVRPDATTHQPSTWLIDILRVAGIAFLANYAAALLSLGWDWLGLFGVPGSYQLDISDGLVAGVPWLLVGAAGGWIAASTAAADRWRWSVVVLAVLFVCQHFLSGGVWRMTAHSIEVFALGAALMSGAGAVLGGLLQQRRRRRDVMATGEPT